MTPHSKRAASFFDAVLTDDECFAHGALANSDTDPPLHLWFLMAQISARKPLCEQARPEYASAEQIADQRRRHALGERVQAARRPACERSRPLPAIEHMYPPDEREEQQPVPADEQRERRFRQIYEEHYRPVQAYAVRRLGAQADVADVVAEVFTTAWRRLDDIPPPPEARLWLYGVARRVLAGHHRSKARFRKLITRIGATETPHQPEPDPRDDQLIQALRQIPPAEREALMLTVWEQLSHAEAAQVLGCSPNAVGIRVHRARARLREALGGIPTNETPVHTGGNHAR